MLNLNTPNKQWNMYLNTLSSISGDDLTIKPDTRRNLLLEVSGNNNIFIKKGDISYNLSNLIIGDVSFSNVDVSVNLNPLLPNNNSNLGLASKLWGNAYIRDISATNISISGNMTISGTISNVIRIIPRLANDISLGSNTNTWQRAFIRDLSNISTINGTNWPLTGGPTGATGATGATGPTGPAGPAGALGVSINATLTDISNFRITTNRRIYQEISGDISWNAVNGYYGLAKDAYPSLNPWSSGDLAVKTWAVRTAPSAAWTSVCWSPELGLFVAVAEFAGQNSVMTSPDGIAWTQRTVPGASWWLSICWSPQLRLFVAVGWGNVPSDARVMTSSDGITWTLGIGSIGSPGVHVWRSVCWSPELGIFVVVGNSGPNKVMISSDGKNWTQIGEAQGVQQQEWYSVCWSAELGLFVATSTNSAPSSNRVMTSSNGTSWIVRTVAPHSWYSVCWSSELSIFVAVSLSNRVMTSSNGIDWITTTGFPSGTYRSICWCKEIRLFVAVGSSTTPSVVPTSLDGITWSQRVGAQHNGWRGICWSSELGIAVAVSENGNNRVMTSSLKGRPPTSYNVFDSSFNRIDENGKWDFSNINVTRLTVSNGPPISSDDRLKHNEVVINNGLDIIDQLSPKFYQKTQVLLDASYNGDLSGYAWTLEAGLIAQELLKISDLSYVVSGGDYYEQTYNLIKQTNDLSNANYDLSNSYYDLSNFYYDLSNANYEVSYNLIAQHYNVNYNSVFVYGLAAIKELHAKVKAKETSILNRQAIINSLITRIEALESNNNV